MADMESPPPLPIAGFPRVAVKLASDPDKSTIVFRRFDQLSCRSLLYLQAELAELETLQSQFDEEDLMKPDQVTIECHSDFKKFKRRAQEKDGDGKVVFEKQADRMELALKIKKKLKEYHEALTLHQNLLNTPPPARTTMTALKSWFLGEHNTNPTPQLWGSSRFIFSNPSDLIALKTPEHQDHLASFILHRFGNLFPFSSETDIYHKNSAIISSHTLSKALSHISTLLSFLLLFGSITSLFFTKNQYALLGLLGFWTVLFAFCISWLTDARRDQVFAATAAYAAVLVVFVSGGLGNSNSNGNAVMTRGNWTCILNPS